MKQLLNVLMLIFAFTLLKSCKKSNSSKRANSRPLVQLTAEMTNANPFTFKFTATASDVEADPLKFTWNFGEGTVKEGGTVENFTYQDNKEYTIKVTVSDGKSEPIDASLDINTLIAPVSVNFAQEFQTMEGFGGFGAKDNYWTSGPFTSAAFVNSLINDLGLTILRDEIPSNFEIVNDNNDPSIIDLTKYNINNNTSGVDGKLADHLQYLKDMSAAGLDKLIVSIWSAPAWMKTNNRINNGTTQNSAPPYNPTPTANDNQLRTDMYEEFAEMCVAYIKIIKQETGINVYALSVQNEPRFSQFYASCVFNGAALRDLVTVVGKRFKEEGLTTKLFLPEDIGWLQGIEGMVKPTLDDPAARQYVDMVAVHGYDLDGITANSPNAQTWQTMFNWGATYNIPLWMTETSGYKNDWNGAMSLAKAIYTALHHGNVAAWVYWSLSAGTLDEYCLMSSSGQKSKSYFVSKNFYRYIRPGAKRVLADAAAETKIYPLAFKHDAQQATTIILINDNNIPKAIKLNVTGLPGLLKQLNTSSTQDCVDAGTVNSNENIVLHPNSVTTLYWKN
ncbi:MAG: PKD domain-containing protein [Chitinophagaceae bacterium]